MMMMMMSNVSLPSVGLSSLKGTWPGSRDPF